MEDSDFRRANSMSLHCWNWGIKINWSASAASGNMPELLVMEFEFMPLINLNLNNFNYLKYKNIKHNNNNNS